MTHPVPLLADLMVARVLDPGQIPARRVCEHVAARLRAARRFVFTAEASRRFGEVVRDLPELIAREQDFARAPFDVTYVEFDFKEFYAAANPEYPPDATCDARLAFLFDYGTVYTVLMDGSLTPLAVDLHSEWGVEDQLKFCATVGTSRAQLDGWAWGTVLPRLSEAERRALRSKHSARALPLRRPEMSRAVWDRLFWEETATLRNIVAVLLLLNRPSVVTFGETAPRRRGLLKGREAVYMEHTTVSIDVDPAPVLRRLGTPAEAATPKRRHEVRRTWCHDAPYRAGTERGCVHAWAPHPDHDAAAGTNWLCGGCGGHRWQREAHMRGDATRGFVAKDYVVKKTTRDENNCLQATAPDVR